MRTEYHSSLHMNVCPPMMRSGPRNPSNEGGNKEASSGKWHQAAWKWRSRSPTDEIEKARGSARLAFGMLLCRWMAHSCIPSMLTQGEYTSRVQQPQGSD